MWRISPLGVFLTAAICCLAVAACGQLAILLWIRRKKMRRANWTREAFVEHCSVRGVSVMVSGCVYDHLLEIPGMQRLPPDPKDRLSGVYGICDEDMGELCSRLCTRLGVVPGDKEVDLRNVETVEELVVLLEEVTHSTNR